MSLLAEIFPITCGSLLRAYRRSLSSDRAISICPHRSEILKIPVPAGSDLNKGAGVVVLGCSQHERGRAGFDDASILHDHDRVADLRGDAQIVRDEQNRDAADAPD